MYINNDKINVDSKAKLEGRPQSAQTPVSDSSGGYDAMMASIIAGANISNNFNSINLNHIPFADQQMGQFACATVLNNNMGNHI